jgi:hypothetical protein
MKTITRFLASAVLFAGVFTACSDLSVLEKKVDSLESRVTALEKVIPTLNSNIEGLQALMSAGTINNAKEENGVWTITLSNGETISLTQGSVGIGNAPVMSVDKDGYWMVNYGEGEVHILNGEEKVMAVGTNGITPVFGVDAEGFWTISYDEGKTFQQVLGADGKAVNALPQGEAAQDPYFEEVKIVDGILTITLRGGETVTVPVISDFICAIEAQGMQTFGQGETKPYNVTLKGAKSTMISAPAGWKAVLSEPVEDKATLTVTAPVLSKGALADSDSDISILAFSAQGYGAIAKLQVEISGSAAPATPYANVTAGEATETTLSYNVATANTTSWKYLHVKADETAPDAAKIAADGVAGTGTAVTVEGLESATAYILYVLPLSGETQGEVVSCQNTTKKAPIASYYALYEAGQTITIAGKEFSKAVNGDATLMEADGTISADGVYFIKEGVKVSHSGTGATKKLIVIGDKDGVKCTFKTPIDNYMKLNSNQDGTGYVVFHNMIIDQTEKSSQYAITVNQSEKFPLVLFSNCEIKQNSEKTLFYIGNAARSIADLKFIDCICNITSTQPFLAVGSVASVYGTYTVSNCIFYGDGTKTLILHNGNKASYDNIIFTNNTFVNVLAGNNVLFNCGTIKNTTITGNLFYMKKDIAISSNQSVVNSASTIIEGGQVNDNISYTGQTNTYMPIYGGKEKWFEGVKEFTKLESDPFEGGTFNVTDGKFVPAAAYASYGAQR